MKCLQYSALILLAMCTSVAGQSSFTGTWASGGSTTAFFILKVDGGRAAGTVEGREIYEGRAEGNTITFKVTSPDGDRVITFTGTIDGDEIAFSRAVETRPGGSTGGAVGIFSAASPLRFTARRRIITAGTEFAAGVNLPEQNVKGEAVLFLPQGVNRVRAVMVVIGWGLGLVGYDSPEWRKVAESLDLALLRARLSQITEPITGPGRVPPAPGANVLQILLRRLAEDTGHYELAAAPLLFWGFSAGGALASGLAAQLPERTVAFVRYHSAESGDTRILSQFPALMFVGGKDARAGADDQWRSGRSVGAPWTYALEPLATHGNPDDLTKADQLLIPWITAVTRQRLSPVGDTLQAIPEASAWIGNNRTGEVAPVSSFPGSTREASWLPDEKTAEAWRAVVGAAK